MNDMAKKQRMTVAKFNKSKPDKLYSLAEVKQKLKQ